MMKSVEVRSRLVEAVKLDLVGPENGSDLEGRGPQSGSRLAGISPDSWSRSKRASPSEATRPPMTRSTVPPMKPVGPTTPGAGETGRSPGSAALVHGAEPADLPGQRSSSKFAFAGETTARNRTRTPRKPPGRASWPTTWSDPQPAKAQ